MQALPVRTVYRPRYSYRCLIGYNDRHLADLRELGRSEEEETSAVAGTCMRH